MLIMATVGFALTFWAWALLSPLGAHFKQVLGLSSFGAALSEWLSAGFGQLSSATAIRLVIVSSTMLVLGVQILYGSFFLYLLDYRSLASPYRHEVPHAS